MGPGFIATHAVHLPTGKILFWDGVENQYLWNINTGAFEYAPAIYTRNGCVFDGLVDCTIDAHCAEYCNIVKDGHPGCAPQPSFDCVMGTCALDNAITCILPEDCEEYCNTTGATEPECNPPPDFTCDLSLDGAELFCAGHTLGVNGGVTVAGGNVTGSPKALGKREIVRFTDAEQWERIEDVRFNAFRWYPTVIQLGDERIFVLGGDTLNAVEIYDPNAAPDDAVESVLAHPADVLVETREGLKYPFLFQIELGLVFFAGGEGLINPNYWSGFLFDSQFTNSWVKNFQAPSTIPGGSAVLYQRGMVMKSGGCRSFGNRCQATDITEIINVSSIMESPPTKWEVKCPMHHPRHFHTLTLLPDGKVLATGGNTEGNGHGSSYCQGGTSMAECDPKDMDLDCTVGRCSNSRDFETCDMMNPCTGEDEVCFIAGGSCEEYDNADFSTKSAEIWDPDTKKWTELAAQSNPRMYHSTALLLPDGRVLSAGGGKRNPGLVDQFNAEFFSPPYLFQGTRPTISTAPASIDISQAFEVTLGNVPSSDIERVTLIRLASVTHQFDMDQRFIELDHMVMTPSTLRVDAPPNVGVAPPGWYMLFVLDDGVPSIGEYVQVLAE